jgi:hypothetical protein
MSTLKVSFETSAEWRNAEFIRTGEQPKRYQEVSFDMAEATPEQRKVIIWAAPDLTISLNSEAEFSGPPTLEQVLPVIVRKAEAEIEQEKKSLDRNVRWATERIASAIENKNVEVQTLARHELQKAASLGIDLREYSRLAAEHERLIPEFKAYKAARDAEYQRRKDELEAAEAQKRKAAEAEKLAWAQAHGSEHLRRACAGGYNCQRMYVTERAGQELPGFTVDFDKKSEWTNRACPSLTALDVAEAAIKAGHDATVVWFTAGPRGEDEYEFEPCEGVVIREYLGKYDLVRLFPE